MLKAVVHTNVLISGLLGSRTNRRIIEAFRNEQFLLVLNPFRRISILTPAQFLRRVWGDYQKALEAADALAAKHPDDPLILRYRALTLEKLGRRKEAIAAYRKILAAHPGHAPTHLFLGLAYAKEGRRDEAAAQLRWVAQHSGSDEYRHWAQAQLSRLRQRGKKAAKRIEQKLYLRGKTAVAYDSNPLLIPDDESLSSRSKEDGAFFRFDLDAGYPFVLRKDLRVDASGEADEPATNPADGLASGGLL